MQKVTINNKSVQLPFDGRARNSRTVASMIGDVLTERREAKLDIIFPVQWDMEPITILHPTIGVLAMLKQNSTINTMYKFTYLARNGEIGVTAIRC